MKKTTTLLAILLFSVVSVSAQYYEFSMRTETYSEFVGSPMSPPEWDDEQGTLPMPFDFYLFGEFVNEITVYDEYYTFGYNANYIAYFTALGADLESRGAGESPISIDVEGETPNTIVKAQLKNGGFVGDNTGNDYVNYQVWIYESTNVIEIHFGESSINNAAGSFDGESGPLVGIQKADLTKALGLSGNPQDPTEYDETASTEMYLNGVPSSGTVYVFTPRKFPVGVNLVSNDIKVSAYPNPVNDVLTIQLDGIDKAEIEIVDVMGKVMYAGNLKHTVLLDTKNYKQGIYFIRVKTTNGIITEKIIKN